MCLPALAGTGRGRKRKFARDEIWRRGHGACSLGGHEWGANFRVFSGREAHPLVGVHRSFPQGSASVTGRLRSGEAERLRSTKSVYPAELEGSGAG